MEGYKILTERYMSVDWSSLIKAGCWALVLSLVTPICQAKDTLSSESSNVTNIQETQTMAKMVKKKIGIVLYPEFEALDVFGPVEMWGNLPDYQVVTVSEHGGAVKSVQGVETNATYSFANAPQFDILMVPGGMGSRAEVHNPAMLEFIRKQNKQSTWTTSVCTGSAILAQAGILKGYKATSNKLAYEFATNQDPDVVWQRNARWVIDGKYVTSSGVSAGTDMALGLVEKLYDRSFAKRIARESEYIWNDNPAIDPFSGSKSR